MKGLGCDVSCGGYRDVGWWFVGVGGVRDMRVRGCGLFTYSLGLCVRVGLEVWGSGMWGGEGEFKVKLE